VKIVLNGTSGFAVPLHIITDGRTAITGKGARIKEYADVECVSCAHGYDIVGFACFK